MVFVSIAPELSKAPRQLRLPETELMYYIIRRARLMLSLTHPQPTLPRVMPVHAQAVLK